MSTRDASVEIAVPVSVVLTGASTMIAPIVAREPSSRTAGALTSAVCRTGCVLVSSPAPTGLAGGATEGWPVLSSSAAFAIGDSAMDSGWLGESESWCETEAEGASPWTADGLAVVVCRRLVVSGKESGATCSALTPSGGVAASFASKREGLAKVGCATAGVLVAPVLTEVGSNTPSAW
jgi:hypothetical protein